MSDVVLVTGSSRGLGRGGTLSLAPATAWPCNGWDHIPEGSRIPRGESTMRGDYHARQLAPYLHRIMENKPYLTLSKI